MQESKYIPSVYSLEFSATFCWTNSQNTPTHRTLFSHGINVSWVIRSQVDSSKNVSSDLALECISTHLPVLYENKHIHHFRLQRPNALLFLTSEAAMHLTVPSLPGRRKRRRRRRRNQNKIEYNGNQTACFVCTPSQRIHFACCCSCCLLSHLNMMP